MDKQLAAQQISVACALAVLAQEAGTYAPYRGEIRPHVLDP